MKKLHQLSHRTLVKTCIALQKREEFLAGRVEALEEALKDEMVGKRERQKRIEELEREQAHRAMQLEHSDQMALDNKRIAAREARKFLRADSLNIRYRGGLVRIRSFTTAAMKAAWADSGGAGPSHELESLAGAIMALDLMVQPQVHQEAEDREDSKELTKGYST